MLFSLVYLSLIFFIYWLYVCIELNEPTVFLILNVAFSLFTIVKLLTIRRISYFFINPIVLATIFMFLLSYGFPYLIGIKYKLIDVNIPYEYLIRAMLYVSISFVLFWHVYFSKQLRVIAQSCISSLTIHGSILRSNNYYNYKYLYILFALYCGATLLDIRSGSYGYLSVFNDRSGMYQVAAVINLFSYIGSGVIFLLLLIPNLSKNKKNVVFCFFIINILFQLLSGSKGAVIRSVLVLFVADYIKNRKIKMYIVAISFTSIIMAYAIVEPYRIAVKLTQPEPKSVSEIVGVMANGFKLVSTVSEEVTTEIPSYAFFLSRFSVLYELSSFIEYGDRYGFVRGRDPDFVYRLLTIPLQICVPNAVWKSKPIENLGNVWVNNIVMNRTDNNSLSFGPLGFLYCAGGLWAILVGFTIVALFLKITSIFLYSENLGAIIIAVVMIAFSYTMEMPYNAYLVTLIRFTFIAIIFQNFIICKKICQ